MKHLLRNIHTINLVLASVFFCALLITVFHLYSTHTNVLPLITEDSALGGVYLWFAITAVSGAMTIVLAFFNQREIIVYRNKPEEALSALTVPADTIHSDISLEPVKSSLLTSDCEDALLSSGLQAICKQVDACQGALYIVEGYRGKKAVLKAGYALTSSNPEVPIADEPGDGLIAQVVANGKLVYIDDLPEGYIQVTSGLGQASAKYLLILPFFKDQEVTGVVEVASFSPMSFEKREFIQKAVELVADKVTEAMHKIV